jgi:excisionase family DNA binding protein
MSLKFKNWRRQVTFFKLFGEETNPIRSDEELEEIFGVKGEDFFSEYELSREFMEDVGAIWTIKNVSEILKELDDAEVLLAGARETAQAAKRIEMQQPPSTNAHIALTVKETAAVLGFHKSHVYRLMKFGELSFSRQRVKGTTILLTPSLEKIATVHDVFIRITNRLCEEICSQTKAVQMMDSDLFCYPHFVVYNTDTGDEQPLVQPLRGNLLD